MSSPKDAPADTTMMSVVHDALRRDLARTVTALGESPPPDAVRRVAIGGHVVWMMDFLHHHHEGEDRGLWPLVRRRNPDADELLSRMEADHHLLMPLIPKVSQAGRRYAEDGSEPARAGLLAALAEFMPLLLDHLRREEDDAMPVVSKSISRAEWEQQDQENNIRGKSPVQLAQEGHWMLDGLDPARVQVLVHLVAAPVRFVLLHGFARRYRKAAERRWGPDTSVGPAHT